VSIVNYNKLGLRVGIEIHQRLNTKKLFCNCSSLQSEESEKEIKRKIRPVAGELGEIDPAALYEFLRNRTFVYRLYQGETCLVELDEEPPHPLNREALKIGLQICMLLNCTIPDEIHVMRKTVIDGSNTGGFQRTAIIGMNGEIKTSTGLIKIETVALEEEAARIEERRGDEIVYKLNGLGIPLIEIATSADIHSPEQAKEVAEKIGMLLRATNVQRGIGTIRQDVNISIAGGARIEVKGFQELADIPKLVENEAKRQASLIEIKKELQKRGLKEIKEAEDVTKLFENAQCNFIKKNKPKKILALKLEKFAGLLKKECGDRTFGKELSAYAGAYGYGIIHSDEDLEKYKLNNEFRKMREKLKAKDEDAVLIIAGDNPEKAMEAVKKRAGQCSIGVPEETRVADGVGSKYTRPLPGSERMYPETDIPPIVINREVLESIEIPETLEERERALQKILPKELARQIINSDYLEIFEEIDGDPILAATTLTSTITDLKRKGFRIEKIHKKDFVEIFELVKKKEISKDSVPSALEMVINGNKNEIKKTLGLMDDEEMEKIVKDIIKKNKDLNEKALMGLAMEKLRGRAEGKRVMEIVRKSL